MHARRSARGERTPSAGRKHCCSVIVPTFAQSAPMALRVAPGARSRAVQQRWWAQVAPAVCSGAFEWARRITGALN